MNERILELARQVWPDPSISHINHLKFAELLIRECADVLAAEMNRLDELDLVISAQAMDTAQVLIKQHFGVDQ